MSLREMANDPVLTLADAAEQLQVHKGTLAAMLRKGIIPAQKVGREWRISETALKVWLAKKDLRPHHQAELAFKTTKKMQAESVSGYKTVSFLQCVSAMEAVTDVNGFPFLPREYASMILTLPTEMDEADAAHVRQTFHKDLDETLAPYFKSGG